MRILFIGDVVGRPGREAVRTLLPGLKDEFQLDAIVANGENSAGGLGATSKTINELLDAGVDVVTLGNEDGVRLTAVVKAGASGRVHRDDRCALVLCCFEQVPVVVEARASADDHSRSAL